MKKTKILAISTLSLILFVSGCGQTPKLKNGEDAVLTYKNGKISINTLYNKMKNSYAVTTLIDMFDTEVLGKKYKTDDTETKAIEKQLSQYETYYKQYYTSTYSSYNEFLNAYFGTSDTTEIKKILSLNYKRSLVAKDYSESIVTKDEIQKYYDENIKGDIKASHILIKPKTTSKMTDTEKTAAEEKAKATAESIIKKLNSGEDFNKLAKKYSDDDSIDLGWFNTGDMVTEFEDAAYKLKKGTYTTEPVKTEYGYHIILKTGEKQKATLAKVKQSIITTLGKEKLTNDASLYYTALKEFRKDNKFEIKDNDLRRLYEAYVDNQVTKAKSSESSTTSTSK